MKQSELAISITTNIVYKICIVTTVGRCLQIAGINSELVRRYPPNRTYFIKQRDRELVARTEHEPMLLQIFCSHLQPVTEDSIEHL